VLLSHSRVLISSVPWGGGLEGGPGTVPMCCVRLSRLRQGDFVGTFGVSFEVTRCNLDEVMRRNDSWSISALTWCSADVKVDLSSSCPRIDSHDCASTHGSVLACASTCAERQNNRRTRRLDKIRVRFMCRRILVNVLGLHRRIDVWVCHADPFRIGTCSYRHR
jgi:hypothetical protein